MPNNELYKITATLQQKNNPQASVAPQKTTEQLAAERLFAKTASSATDISQKSTTASGLAVVRPIEYTVPKEAIYDRLNDGSYVAKFENYIGAEGNENRLAKEQSTGEKWGHGATKMVAKIGTYAFDSVVGTAYGIGAAIGTGQFSKLYDNDFTSAMDDLNKRLDNNFVNYYSDEEKSMGVLQSMGTANFWANDVTGGLAFVGGAILPSIALGALTGGATVSAGAGKLASKWGMNLAKQTTEEALEATGKSGIKNYVKTKLASAAGSVVDKGAFFVRTSAFEAGMEARQSYKTNVQDFYTKFEEQNGRLPTAEEAKPFLEDARNASNGVFNANLAILSVSNAVMFGKKILPTISSDILGTADNFAANALRKGINSTVKFGDKVTNKANTLIGLGVKTEMVDGVLTKSMIKATKGQKILGNVYKIAKKPLTEGLYEEGFQGVTTKTAENFLDAKYDPQNTETLSLMANLADGFKEQYGSNEGWKEMAVGMIIGFGGGGMSPGAFKKGSGAFSGLGSDSRASTQKQMEANLTKANEGVVAFRNLNRTEGARAFAVNGADGKVARNYEDTVAGYNFIKSQEHISTPGQILEDHNKTIDAMEFQEPDMKEFLADRGVTEQEYKDSLKSSFDTTLKQYRQATSWVNALGLDRGIKETDGNKTEIKEALVMNTMLGMSSLEESKKHLDQFDKLTGASGTFDAHEFYQSLSDEQQEQVALLDKKTAELEELKKQAVRLGEQAAGSKPSAGQTSDQLNKQRVQTSEKAFQTQQAVIRLAQEIEDLTKGLSSSFDTHQAEQRAKDSSKLPQDINSVLNRLREANSYVDSLSKAGETATATAGTIKYLIDQAKYHSAAHREMVNMQRRMLSTNFFSSKEGKSLVGRILGKTYVMSDDLRKSIQDNDAFIDSSLRLMGQRGTEAKTVTEVIQETLEANPNLSEREKHRLEDILRLQLTGNVAAAIVEDLTTASEQITATQVKDTKGDTVALAKKLKEKTADITTLKVITEVIDEITSELDSIIGANGKNAAEIASLKEQLQTLKDKRDAIEESIKQEEIDREQSSSTEREGADSRQSENWESSGIERKETTDETDNSDSIITSEAQKEVERLLEERAKVEVEYGAGLSSENTFKTDELEISIKEIPSQGYAASIIQKGKKFDQGDEFLTKEEAITFAKDYIAERAKALIKEYDMKISSLSQQDTQTQVEAAPTVAELEIEKRRQEELSKLDKDYKNAENAAKVLKLSEIVGKKVLYKGQFYTVAQEKGGLVLDSPSRVYELSDDTLSNLGVSLYDEDKFQGKYEVSSVAENEVTINGTEYTINVSSNGNIESLSPKNNPTQKLTNENLLVATEIARNKVEFIKLETVTEVEYNNTVRDNVDANTLDQIYNKNYSDTVDRGLEKLMAGEKLTPAEKLALDLWVTEALINLTNVYAKTPSEALAAGMDILEGINIQLYTDGQQTQSLPETSTTSSEQTKGEETGQVVPETSPATPRVSAITTFLAEKAEEAKQAVNEKYNQEREQLANEPQAVVTVATETPSTETIAGPETAIPSQPTELEKIDAEIAAVENRLKKLEGERYQIIESQEYARFTQLSAKKEKGELTPNEEAELEELKDDLDKWTMITGVVIDGFRLSDLIEQKVVLESTPIIEPENVVVQETQETMQDIDIPDKTRGANTTFGNTAHKVIFSTEGTGENKIYTIYHLTQDGLIKEVGDLPIKTDRLDERNNILLTAEEVRLINENTDLKIITDSKYSRASTVIKAKLLSDGSTEYVGLDSDFNEELREGIDFQAVFEANGRTEDTPGDEIEVFVDPKSDYNKTNLARIRNLIKELEKTKKNPAKTKAIKEQIKAEKVWLQENLQVMARIGDKVVASFKGIRGGVKNDTDLLFAEFRKAIISDDNNLAALTSDTANGVITVKVKGKDGISRNPVITVKQVLLGIPNYNYDQNAEGGMVTVFKPIPEQQQSKVVDMGYSLNGKTFTRDGKTVNTTFLSAMTKRNKTGKIPFVVLEVGGKRVAYPVRVETSKEVNTEEFEAIYNSDRSDSDKAKSLNRFMAANGIDIKDAGNAFISFGVTNLTDDNFQNKLAQLKAINYFYNVEDWVAEGSNMKDILTNQVTIDIDVLNPFHSPKLMFDYSQLDLAKGKVTKESTAAATSDNIDDSAEESSLFGCTKTKK